MSSLRKIKAGQYEGSKGTVRYAYCGRCGHASARWLVVFNDGQPNRFTRTLADARALIA